MGRLYYNNRTIGYYHGSYVTVNYSDTKAVAKYDKGLITVNGHYIALCDAEGYIYAESNKSVALARCKDGLVYDLNKSGYNVIARYDSDMYGAAAAVASLILHLDNSGTSDSKTKDSNSNNVQTNISENSNVSTSESGGGCISAIIGILTAILLFVPILLWNFLPLVLCIGSFAIVILDDVIDFNNDVDSLIIGLLIIYIPIMLSGICNILINFNSIREKITKKQANFCRLIHNAGIILSLITIYIYNCSFAMGSSLSLAPKPTPLGFFFGILSSVILWITPIITYIFLRKCKKL